VWLFQIFRFVDSVEWKIHACWHGRSQDFCCVGAAWRQSQRHRGQQQGICPCHLATWGLWGQLGAGPCMLSNDKTSRVCICMYLMLFWSIIQFLNFSWILKLVVTNIILRWWVSVPSWYSYLWSLFLQSPLLCSHPTVYKTRLVYVICASNSLFSF